MTTKKANKSKAPAPAIPSITAETIRNMIIDAYVPTLTAINESVRPIWEAALAKANSKKEEAPEKDMARAITIARCIKAGDFGCRSVAVASLMGVSLGLPVKQAYVDITAASGGEGVDASRRPGYVNLSGRISGVILINIKTKAMILIDHRDATYYVGRSGGGSDHTRSDRWCNAKVVRPATELEIRAFVIDCYSTIFNKGSRIQRWAPAVASVFK